MQCGISADTHFGPRVLPYRRDFDFTLLFEQGILALTPDLLFLTLCIFQWYHLYRNPKKVRRGTAGTWKVVGLSLSCGSQSRLASHYDLKTPGRHFLPYCWF